jgi:shikimate dehydrogenase
MYAPAFAAMGIEARCEKWVTPPEELAAAVARLRTPEVLGANVTVPHKEAVIPLIDELDDSAKDIGAVNCIVREDNGSLRGHNTDKYGFVRSLREAGFEPAGTSALLLGAGGAARAVAVGLLEGGVSMLSIANRSPERSQSLARNLRDARVSVVGWRGADYDAACAVADLVVNTTPTGTAHTALSGESPMAASNFRTGVWAYDLVYNPAVTPFLEMAAAAGAKTVSGLEMLIYQGAESIHLFTGREPPVDIMRTAARAAVNG